MLEMSRAASASIFVVDVISREAVVLGSTAANAVDEGDEDKETGVEKSQTPPLLPNVGQHSSLARLAIIA